MISKRKLPVENNQSILRSRQCSDADGITPNDIRRDLGWIITGTKNGNLGARALLQQSLEIAIGQDQDKIMRCGVFQDSPIASEPISESAFRLREQTA
jgi:hypothetical protein